MPAMIPDVKLSMVNGLPLGGESILTSSVVEPLLGGGVAALGIKLDAALS